MKEFFLSPNEGPPDESQKLKTRGLGGFKVQTRPSLLTCLVMLTALIGQTHAQLFEIQSIKTSAQPLEVNEISKIDVMLVKKFVAKQDWNTNTCFRLRFISPYVRDSDYFSFDNQDPKSGPVCKPDKVNFLGFTMSCALAKEKSGKVTSDTVEFKFDSFQYQEKGAQVSGSQQNILTFSIENFRNPYSSVNIDVQLQTYQKRDCSGDQKNFDADDILFTYKQSDPIDDKITFTSSSTDLGNFQAENELIVKFIPKTTLAPNGQGIIKIVVPDQLKLEGKKITHFDPKRERQDCRCAQLKELFSTYKDNILSVQFSKVEPGFLSGKEIKIICKGFKNPIAPEPEYGYGIIATDKDQNIIFALTPEKMRVTALDASNFTPAIMQASAFEVSQGNNVVGTFSTWQISIQSPIPLATDCWVQIMLPTDLTYRKESLLGTKLFAGQFGDQEELQEDDIRFFDGTPQDKRTSMVIHACKNQDYLDKAPSGSLQYSMIAMPRMVKTTEFFHVNIYKDEEMKKLVVKMDEGVSIEAARVDAGQLQEVTVNAEVDIVQSLTTLIVKFITSHSLTFDSMIEIKMPGNFTLSPQGTKFTVERITEKKEPLKLQASVEGGGTYIEIYDVLKDLQGKEIPENFQFELRIPKIKLQRSAVDAGAWAVKTKAKYNDGLYYDVDKIDLPTSLTARPGSIIAEEGSLKEISAKDSEGAVVTMKVIQVSDPITWGKDSMYTLRFKSQNDVPKGGYIKMEVPPQIKIDISATKTMGTCQDEKCTDQTNEKQIVILQQNGLAKDTAKQIRVGGLQNPRSFQPTDDFIITTLDTDGESIIDTGFNKQAAMEKQADLDQFYVTAASQVNGAKNKYTFSMQSQIPFITGDTLYFLFPTEITPPPPDQVDKFCGPGTNLIKVSCSIVDGGFILTVIEAVPQDSIATYGFTVDMVTNAPSTKPTGAFAKLNLRSKEKYRVVKYSKEDRTMTNLFPAEIVDYKLEQVDLTADAATTYTVKFNPANRIPKSGQIILTYPEELTLLDGDQTQCLVTTYKSFPNSCQITSKDKQIIINNVFSSDDKDYYGEISIQLKNVKNPTNNKKIANQNFIIMTYADVARKFIIDKTEKIKPVIECDYPCKSCLDSNRGHCLSCWQDVPSDPQYLMPLDDKNPAQTCKSACDQGYSSNSDTKKAKVCDKCDVSCDLCHDSDVKDCINCAKDFPLRLTQSKRCFAKCALGTFQSTKDTCSVCKAPCFGCEGTESTCTQCDPKSEKAFLYNNQCNERCPDGYTSVNNVCMECVSPCSECKGLPTFCTTCNGKDKRTNSYNGGCYEVCPPGSSLNATSSVCQPCPGSGCSLCDLNAPDNCLLCKENLYILNNQCVTECPPDQIVNDDKTSCRKRRIEDLGILYFPFIIAGLIFTVVVFFGNMRKKARLVKGRAELYSAQKSITCILVFLQPLQAGALIVQWAFAFAYELPTHAILAIAASVIIIVTSVVFSITFHTKFKNKELPEYRKKQLAQNRITKEAAATYYVYKDEKFGKWSEKHYKMWSVTTAFSFISSWKFNKLYYSHFYNYAMFQASWTKQKDYRNMLNWYGIVHMITVDLFCICIAITGLVQLEWGTQLYIEMIETLVLSIVNIGLSAYELYKLPEYLKYTEQEKKPNFAVSSGYDGEDLDRDAREKMMKGLINKVKGNKDIFLNNKLDELLNQFGDRRCKSMIELGTGWDKEEDPRKTKTWPISPGTYAEYDGLDIKFGPDDAYGMFDNVYADGVTKPKGKEKAAQGDAAQMEFQDALNRKHGDMMSKIDNDVEEQRRLKGNKRRGRKNKYHTQIDNEDDEEAEAVEASDEEHRKNDLQIIKEQEEEEENLRKQVAAEKKRQGEQAADKKAQMEREERTKLELEKAEEEARKQKALLEEAERRNKEEQQARMRLEEELARMKLQQEVALEEAKRAAKEREELLKKAQMNDDARNDYEAKEAERLKLEAERLAQEKAQAEAREKELVAQLAEERRKREEQTKLNQQEKDAQAIKEKKEALKKAEADRESQKQLEAQKKKEEADKKKAEEAALKEKKKKEEEAAAAKKLAEKEAAKAKEEEEKKKKQAEKEAKAMADAEEKARKKPAQPEPVAKKQVAEKKEKESVLAVVSVNNNEEVQKSARSGSTLSKVEPGKAQEIELTSNVNKDQAPKPQINVEEEDPNSPLDDVNNTIVETTDNLLQNFRQDDKPIQTPPNAQLRLFNEHDILGDLDRDEKGNVIVLQDNKGNTKDRQGKPTNKRGYLVDPKTGALIENLTFKEMFLDKDLDERGEVPAPFCVEKFNFNAHNIMGDFDYVDGQPRMMVTNKGFFVDKKGRRVNKFGWMVLTNQGHVMDRLGRKKLDKKQLTAEGDIPKLFTLSGKRYDIKDVMGQFDKDQLGRIIPHTSKNGKDLLDNLGRRVNDKGYLIDPSGNIIDVNNKQLFTAASLKTGEFIKIFPFTKFNIKKVQGDYEMNPSGNPILVKTKDGTLRDKKNRLVNKRGYLIDQSGNVIDERGKPMFDLCVLEEDGEIPAVFRTGLLKSDTASSLSRLMSDIEKHPSEFDRQEENKINKDPAYEILRHGDGDTSVDSKMDDTPANYNQANQRFDQDYDDVDAIPEDDENAEHMAPSEFDGKEEHILPTKKPKKKKKKQPKTTTIEFLQPTNREISMAGAYGGAAKGQIRRQGIKYDKERLQGSKKFRVSTADEPKVRAQLQQLANSVSGFNATGGEKARPPKAKHQGLMGNTNGFDSNDGKSEKPIKGADNQAKVHPEKKKGLKDGDFEQMFGKDIDQFLEDSEWDIESQFDDKVSHYSKASSQRQNDQKLKAIEKLYLKRLEAQPGQPPQAPGNPKKKGGQGPQGGIPGGIGYEQKKPKYPKIKPERETIISFTDDPGVIHRGEILPFLTKQKKDEVPFRGSSSLGMGGQPMMKEKSSKGSPER